MQQITLISISIFFFGIFLFRDLYPIADTQIVLRINGMIDNKTKFRLEKELNNISGVQYCEALLSTNTIKLKINYDKIKQKDIETALNKWDCSIEKSHYIKLIEESHYIKLH